MGHLDAHTLLIAEIPILLLVGGLILAAALLGRRERTLGWTGAALLLMGWVSCWVWPIRAAPGSNR